MTSFGDAWKSFLTNAFNFDGRSTRAAFWWVILGLTILGVSFYLLIERVNFGVAETSSSNILSYILVVLLVFILPLMSLTVRRFQDTGVSPIILGLCAAFPVLSFATLCIAASGRIEEYRESSDGTLDRIIILLNDYSAYVAAGVIIVIVCLPSGFSKYLKYPMDDF